MNDTKKTVPLNQIEVFLQSPLLKKQTLRKIHKYKKILTFKRNVILKNEDLKEIYNLKNYIQRFVFYIERFPFQNKLIYEKNIINTKNLKLQKKYLSFKGLLMLEKFLLQ